MRVALLADQFFNPSGVGVYSQEILKQLLARNDARKFKVIYPGRKGAARVRELHPTWEVVEIPDRRFLYPLWHTFDSPSIDKWIGDCDLVHFLSGSVSLPAKCPSILCVHDAASISNPSDYPFRRRWFKAKMLERALDRRAKIVTVSYSARKEIARFLGISEESISVTHLGVDRMCYNRKSEQAVSTLRQALNLPNKFFLFVGVLSPRKNAIVLLRAFERYCSTTDGRADLVVVGPDLGWKNGETNAFLAEMGARNRVHLLGFVPQIDMPTIYSAATALILPSRYEGFGLPLIEAMACGLPVICSNATSLPEIAGDAAILIAPDDVPGFSNAMQLIDSSTEERDRLARLGIARSEIFTWGECAKQTVQIYDSILRQDAH
jgi:glycosyltransferase involved in cell wall biosynthesis